MINSANDAKKAIDFAKYPPTGREELDYIELQNMEQLLMSIRILWKRSWL